MKGSFFPKGEQVSCKTLPRHRWVRFLRKGKQAHMERNRSVHGGQGGPWGGKKAECFLKFTSSKTKWAADISVCEEVKTVSSLPFPNLLLQ